MLSTCTACLERWSVISPGLLFRPTHAFTVISLPLWCNFVVLSFFVTEQEPPKTHPAVGSRPLERRDSTKSPLPSIGGKQVSIWEPLLPNG